MNRARKMFQFFLDGGELRLLVPVITPHGVVNMIHSKVQNPLGLIVECKTIDVRKFLIAHLIRPRTFVMKAGEFKIYQAENSLLVDDNVLRIPFCRAILGLRIPCFVFHNEEISTTNKSNLATWRSKIYVSSATFRKNKFCTSLKVATGRAVQIQMSNSRRLHNFRNARGLLASLF